MHARLGLFVSYRGALAFPERLPLPAPRARPCDTCAAPCLRACPVGALAGAGYDLAACHAWLDTAPGRDCLAARLRRAAGLPGRAGPAAEAQSAFHMTAFHGRQRPCDG